MAQLSFYDCNARLGRSQRPRPTESTTKQGLLREMDRCGIARALVHHAESVQFSPSLGNARLVEEVADEDRLTPCWVALPSHTGEQPLPDVAEMLAAGVRAVRLTPVTHRYVLNEVTSAKLLGTLASRRLPVLLSMDESSWAEVDGILSRHPTLPLIVLDVGYRCDRNLYPLLEKHAGLRVETATYGVHRGIEEVCGRFGPERLVFGTGMPGRDPGGAMAAITYAEVGDRAKQMMAGGNLEALLEGAS
ncbi:MAG: amidohydrolase family protein [Armatimonadota bacterium]